MPRDAEIALARTAAPATISDRATVKVLTTSGFIVAQQGDNGNVCMVMRGFSAPTYTPAQFRDLVYDPTVRAPICFTAPAAKTAMPYYELRTKLALAGKDSRPDRRGGEVGVRERHPAAPRRRDVRVHVVGAPASRVGDRRVASARDDLRPATTTTRWSAATHSGRHSRR